MSKKKKKVIKKKINKKTVKKKTNNKRKTTKKIVSNKPIVKTENKVIETKEDVVIEPVEEKVIVEPVEEKVNENKKVRKNIFKNKKLIIRILCILILIFLIMLLIKPKKNVETIEFNSISIDEYLELYDSKDLEYIFITDNNCEKCDKAKITLDKLKTEYSIKINELNINELSSSDKKRIQESNTSLKDNIDVPLLLSIKGGLEIGKISLDKEYSALKKFIDYSSNPSTVNSFNKISVNKYLSLLKSNEIAIIYIGSHTNNECQKFSTILESVSQELNFKVNFLDTDLITKSDDWKKLNSSNKIFEENWFMPAILIVKEGNIVGYKMESMDKDTLSNFFDRYGL